MEDSCVLSGWFRGEEKRAFSVLEMSIRQRATQCLGKHIPDKTNNRLCSPSSRWPGLRARWHEEQENSKLIQTSVTSERIFRSRETVKAWLESSPSSVIDNGEEESAYSSSFDSFSSSPAGSVDHLSDTSGFQKTSPGKVNSPGHTRSRTISPPRRTANRNSADVSRIDYGGGSFLMLAFKNAQYRGSSSPPAFLFTSEDSRDDHRLNVTAEECCSPRSEFSITSEWQYILAAANAAGMSTRDSSGNDSELETSCEALNVSDLDLGSAVGNLCVHPDVVRRPLRALSLELPPVKALHDSSASGEMRNAVDDKKFSILNDSTGFERRKTHVDINYDQSPFRRLPRRNLGSSNYLRVSAEQGPKRGVQSSDTAEFQLETDHTPFMDKSQDDSAIARPKTGEESNS